MSSFGEIAEPVSRTVWEDWDEASPHSGPKLQWQTVASAPVASDKLVILEGKYLYDCIIQHSKNKFELINSVKDVSLHLFKLKSVDEYVCVIKDYNILQSSEIVELLKPYISTCRDVVAVQTKPLAEYQSYENNNQNCISRTVCTTIPSSEYIDFPKLEQPNIVSGVSAGIICLREHLGLSGKVVICFVQHPEEYQIEAVQILLKKLNIIPNNSKPSNVLNSNLYI